MDELAFLILALGILLIISNILFSFHLPLSVIEEEIPLEHEITRVIIPEKNISTSKVEIYVPAVDSEGNGVITTLEVQAIPGEGRVLSNIENLLFWIDTQQSIQVAKEVAEKVTKVNTSKVDLIYTIETNASIIGGPSAGAALTIATIAVLENKSLNKSVMITGTINQRGEIGQVGGIIAKAHAAKEIGAKLFLVPEGQATQYTYKPITECKEYSIPGFYRKICSTEYKKEKVDLSKDLGIEVREVSNIEEALEYFLV